LPEVRTDSIAESPKIGTVTMVASSEEGYRVKAVVTFHRLIRLDEIEGELGSCSPAAVRDTAGAIPFEVKAIDITPNGFHLPAGDVVAVRSFGQSKLVGQSTVAIVPSLCGAIGAAPGSTARGFILIDNFRTPNSPSGDLAQAGVLELYSPQWKNDGLGLDFPNLDAKHCKGTGVVKVTVAPSDSLPNGPSVCGVKFD